MTETRYEHVYQVGDSVLVDMGTARVPGVITDKQGDRLVVSLAEPWADETGNKADGVTVEANRLEPYIEEETGGTQALPAE